MQQQVISNATQNTGLTRLVSTMTVIAGLAVGVASAQSGNQPQGNAQTELQRLAEALGGGIASAEGPGALAAGQEARRVGEPTAEDLERLADNVQVDENEFVTLVLRDEDLQTVLQMLAQNSQRSIVATQNVSGNVTANLYGVTFTEALDSILLYNGFGYIEQGNTIFVMPLEEIQAIEQSQRVRETAVLRLDHLNAVDAAQFAQPLLSDSGSIVTNGATSDFPVSGDGPIGRDDFAHEATLVIHDFPERIDAIRALLAELDTRPSQVLIEATILQTAISEANAFGVDFSIIADLEFTDFAPLGGPLRVVDGLITGGQGSGGGDSGSGDGGDGGSGGGGGGSVIPDDNLGFGTVSSVGNTAAPGGFKVGLVTDSVSVFLRMLDEVGDTTIISSPKILTLNRQAARVQVGRRIGYLSTTTTDTATQQTVEFLDTGTQLYFRPFVTTDGFIRMELRPEVSQPVIRTVTDATGAAITVPDEDTSHLVTNVIVRDGQTIVLGGLFTERTQATRRQVPFVGDLPLIGTAFRGHDDSTDRSEIIFLVTPSIVSDQVLIEHGEEAIDYMHHLRAGAREGLLPWSRERQSAQLLIEAERAKAAGDEARSLNFVRRALSLHPQNSDAIRLRSQLVNGESIWPSRTGLEDIINSEVQQRIDYYSGHTDQYPEHAGFRLDLGHSSLNFPAFDSPASRSGGTIVGRSQIADLLPRVAPIDADAERAEAFADWNTQEPVNAADLEQQASNQPAADWSDDELTPIEPQRFQQAALPEIGDEIVPTPAEPQHNEFATGQDGSSFDALEDFAGGNDQFEPTSTTDELYHADPFDGAFEDDFSNDGVDGDSLNDAPSANAAPATQPQVAQNSPRQPAWRGSPDNAFQNFSNRSASPTGNTTPARTQQATSTQQNADQQTRSQQAIAQRPNAQQPAASPNAAQQAGTQQASAPQTQAARTLSPEEAQLAFRQLFEGTWSLLSGVGTLGEDSSLIFSEVVESGPLSDDR